MTQPRPRRPKKIADMSTDDLGRELSRCEKALGSKNLLPQSAAYYRRRRELLRLKSNSTIDANQMTQNPRYRAVERKGWSYVEGDPAPHDPGPYRYRWEAQEYADNLNADYVDGEITDASLKGAPDAQ
jgi:hypothetical protein